MNLKKVINLLLAFVFTFGINVFNVFAEETRAKEDETAYVSVADPDEEQIKADVILEEEANTRAYSNELQFLYSSQAGSNQTITLYNNETLASHSYITAIGYLMEYLGVNTRNGSYYDVRFQGGVYAIHNSDVARFIPLSQIQSFPYYTNESGYVAHYIEGNPTVADSWYLKTQLGKAPSWMQAGQKYYSFSGIYFTDSIAKLGQYSQQNNAVNPDTPYYDYYLYQPMRTKTSYTAEELNYAFNVLVNYDQTKMTNTGQDFINIQENYGTNALMVLAMGIHESAYGRSSFAVNRNNLFGVGAFDSDPGQAAYFPSITEGIKEQGNYLSWVYADADYQAGANYYGANLGHKSSGMNVKYASDPFWGEKIANHYANIDRILGEKDYQKYSLGIAKQGAAIYWNANGTNKAHNYKNSSSLLTYMYPVVLNNTNSLSEIAMEPPYNQQFVIGSRYPQGGAYFWYKGYLSIDDYIKVSDGNGEEEYPDIIYDGNLTFYLNEDKTLNKAEERINGKITRVYEYYPNTRYKNNHYSHVRNIFYFNSDETLDRATEFEDNTSATKTLKAYEYHSETKYGEDHYSHIKYIFSLQSDASIINGQEYVDNSSGTKLIRAYEYYPGTKYGEGHYRQTQYIFTLLEDGQIINAIQYENNSSATKTIRAYEYHLGTIYGNNQYSRIKYIFYLNSNQMIDYAYLFEDGSAGSRVMEAYEYEYATKYGEHSNRVKNQFNLKSDYTIINAFIYKNGDLGSVKEQIFEYHQGTKYRDNHYMQTSYIFYVEPNDVIKYTVGRNRWDSQDRVRYEYQPNTKYGDNHGNKIKGSYPL